MGTDLWILNSELTRLGWFWVHIYDFMAGSGFIYLDPSDFGWGNRFRTRPNPYHKLDPTHIRSD